MRVSSPLLVAVALILPASHGDADEFVPITLTSPQANAVIHYSSPQEKVSFGAFADVWLTKKVFWNQPYVLGPWVRLTVWSKGSQSSIVREPNLTLLPIVLEAVPVSDLLALSQNKPTADAFRFQWKLEVGTQYYKDGFKPYLSTASSEFTIAGAANLALSVDTDLGSPWPRKVIVWNAGGSKSQPTSLEITFKLRDASDPTVKSRCPSINFNQVHTILALDPNDRRSFDVPAPQGAQPAKPSGGTHKVVTCNYSFDAALAGDTNKLDPNARNNRIQKTVSVDIPLN